MNKPRKTAAQRYAENNNGAKAHSTPAPKAARIVTKFPARKLPTNG